MFYALLAVTLLIAVGVSHIVVRAFSRPAHMIFQRIIQDDIASAWTTYLKFALYVVGISSGVSINSIQRYVLRPEYGQNTQIEELTTAKWVLELYRTLIETLQGLASALLCFFIVSLIAFILVRIIETTRKNREVKEKEKSATA